MAEYNKPLPIPDVDSQAFWDRCKAHELAAQRCQDCGKVSLAAPGLLPALLFVEIRLDETGRNRDRLFFRGRALRVDSCFSG